MTKTRISGVTTLLPALALVFVGIFPTSITAHTGSGIAVDRRGQVYFLDTGSGLWKIDARGRLTHLSRTLFHWLAIDETAPEDNHCYGCGVPGLMVSVVSSLFLSWRWRRLKNAD